MLGAIIGDIVGSRFEFNNHRSKRFELFTSECFPTDNSIMTLAIAKAIVTAHTTASETALPCASVRAALPQSRWKRPRQCRALLPR